MKNTVFTIKTKKTDAGIYSRCGQLKISPEQIIRLESLSNYTYIYFTDHAPILMAKVLHKYEELLGPFGFIRTHRSHLVNTRYIHAIENKASIVMCDDSKAEISRSRRREVLKVLSDKFVAA